MANRRNELNEGYIEGLRAARRIVERALRESDEQSDEWSGEGLPYEIEEMPKGSIDFNFDVDVSGPTLFQVVISFDSIYYFDVYKLLDKVVDAVKGEPVLGGLVRSESEKARFSGREMFSLLFEKPRRNVSEQSVASAFKRAMRSIPQMKYDQSVPKWPY